MLVLPAYFDGDTVKTLRGSLSKYANPKLIEKEKSAWSIASGEKHSIC